MDKRDFKLKPRESNTKDPEVLLRILRGIYPEDLVTELFENLIGITVSDEMGGVAEAIAIEMGE